MKRHVDTIIIHCSATPEGRKLEPADLVRIEPEEWIKECLCFDVKAEF